MFSNIDWDVIIRTLPYLFFDGMRFTIMLTLMATAGGIVIGTLLALARLSNMPGLSHAASAYVNLIRSMPLVLVIFWFFFLVPYIGQWLTGAERPIQVGAFLSALVTFTLFEAFTGATLIYIMINIIVVTGMRWLERRVAVAGFISMGQPAAAH